MFFVLRGYHGTSSESTVCCWLHSERFPFDDTLANGLKEMIEKSLSYLCSEERMKENWVSVFSFFSIPYPKMCKWGPIPWSHWDLCDRSNLSHRPGNNQTDPESGNSCKHFKQWFLMSSFFSHLCRFAELLPVPSLVFPNPLLPKLQLRDSDVEAQACMDRL